MIRRPDHNQVPVPVEEARAICLKCHLPDCDEWAIDCPLFGEKNKSFRKRPRSAPPVREAA